MENTCVISQTDGRGIEDSFYRLGIQMEPSGLSSSESKSQRLVQRLNLNLSFNQLETGGNSSSDPYRQSIKCTIPRHVVSLDEKYLRRCLELIHISAATGEISVKYSSRVMAILAGSSETKGHATFDSARLVFECPLVDGPAGQGNKSPITMVNLLKSPLHDQFGSPDGDAYLRRTKCEDDKAVICYNFMDSHAGLSDLSSPQQAKEMPIPGSHQFGCGSLIGCSDHSSSDSASASQGMLRCRLRGGSPCFVFSVDGKEEVYVANLSKADSADEKALDCVYWLHSTKGSRTAHKISVVDSHLVGKIEVSTSITIGPNNSKIRETHFVLYGNNEKHMIHRSGKPKTLSKKVVDVFRSSHSSKQRAISKFSANCSWDASNTSDDLDLLEKHVPPNFELAAIVVKDHISDNREREIGGWGLKFLKNTVVDCSKSMDIVVPAGVHGGPRNGPSSLIDRWKCGHCDCGGWDMGCPLIALNTLLNAEALNSTHPEGECKTLDVFVKGSEHSAPSLRMVNGRDGFYFVKFQSVLSAMQSFSIAMAFLHTRSPNFQPKYVHG